MITVSASLTGCGDDSKEQNDSDEIPEPSEQEYKHEYGYVNSAGKYVYVNPTSKYVYVNSPEVYSSEEYRYITNCYAYALDIKNNPITGESFYSNQDEDNSQYQKVFGAQPGLFSVGYNPFDSSYKSGTKDGNDEL